MFKEYISETFITPDNDQKNKYKEEVYDLLQNSYRSIGGIKGSGFRSPDDMLNIPLWKLYRDKGKIVAGIMYKTPRFP